MPHPFSRPILFVEDEPSQAQLMMRAFEKAGVVRGVFHVTTGEQLLSYVHGIGQYADRMRFPMPALIVLDLKLPDLSGLQLVNALRSRPETKRIPVVVFSGSADDKMIAAAYDAGANSYIPKSPGARQLAETVMAMVRYWLEVNRVPNPPSAHSARAV